MKYNIYLAAYNMADSFKSNLGHPLAAYDYQHTKNFIFVA